MVEGTSSSIQTKIVLVINLVLGTTSAVLYTYWRNDKKANSAEYIYYSVVVWATFGNLVGDVITTFGVRHCSSWKHWDMSYLIHSVFYAILYIIGGALMAKEAGDLDKKYFVPILNVTVDGCKVNDCDILKGCAAVGLLVAFVSILESFLHYKDYQRNKN